MKTEAEITAKLEQISKASDEHAQDPPNYPYYNVYMRQLEVLQWVLQDAPDIFVSHDVPKD